MLESTELGEILTAAQTIARAASDLLMERWRTALTVRQKGTFDIVTDADLASEELIRERLRREFPEHGIVGEEGDKDAAGDLVWHVDPLDGTINYAHGHPFFSVSIAFCERNQPVVGVVVAPALGNIWSAMRGCGATCNGVRCRVSEINVLSQALFATGFPKARGVADDNNFREFIAVERRILGVRRCGSAAIDLSFIAAGTYDGFWERQINSWDIAAGILFVREAGGLVTDYDGNEADVYTRMLLASNRRVHQDLVRLISEARRKPAV
jgi:myo-inositol-1(or 4)-monophosphatase